MVIELRLRGASHSPQTPPVYAGVSSIARQPFVYPPAFYTASRRHPQVAMPGTPPALPTAAFPVTTEPFPFYFADPLASFNTNPAPQARVVLNRPIPEAHTAFDVRPGPQTAAALASENASRSLTRALGLKVNRIVIDAGHGGHDDGTIGPNGVLEKDVVLDVALRLSKLVQERLGAEVILTRSDDTFIPLHERTAIANEHKADLFLSIHANSSPAPEVAGTETFFLNFTNSPDALNVAARENAGSDKSVGELKDLIQTITMNDKIEESHTFAEDVQTAIQAQSVRANAAAHNRGVKRAPFVVLIGASMPSVLAEIGFLSNARDESNLGKPEYRQKVAEALYKGLTQYSQSLSHFEPSRQIAKTADAKTAEKPVPAGLN
jgi:N-acetylmuramoyl-L-alanine amidase